MATNNAVNTNLSGQTGTGSFAGSTSPTFVTPILGTPTSGNLSNCTAYPATSLTGLGTGVGAALGSAVTGTGGISLTTSPTFVTPILGAASATSMSFSSTSGIIGTTTNNNAAALSVGEYVSSIIPAASSVGLTSATDTNVTSISLTAGDWQLWGNVGFTAAATTNVVFETGWISSTSATIPDLSLRYAQSYGAAGLVVVFGHGFVVPSIRFSLASTTTIFLSVQAVFTVDTLSVCGGIYARRLR